MDGSIAFGGTVSARVIRGTRKAPLSWRLRNWLRWAYLWGLVTHGAAWVFSWIFGAPVLLGELRAVLIKATGERIDYGVLSRRLVTTAGVNYLVDAWDARATNLEDMKYHGCGTGVGAENVADVALGTECTVALNPDSTRGTGVGSQPSANVYRSIATLTFDGGAAVTEHGLFNQAATGGGTLWDRSVFAAINVVAADSIQFTYSMTATAGG